MYGLLLCSDTKEPVSQTVIQYQDELSFPLLVLPLENFLDEVEVFDEVIEGVAKIEWTLQNDRKITNTNKCLLLNRVLSVPERLFDEFHHVDKEYALSEFRAYLAFAIEAFPFSTSKPGPGGLSGGRFSLPQQWDIVQNSEINISTPEYFLGNPHYNTFTNTNRLVQSSPYNYYYWRPGLPSCKNEEINFLFVRPEGIPIVCSVIGKQACAFSYFQEISLDGEITAKLAEISQKLATLFNYFIAECLIFIDGEKITFGMISNIPYASKKKEFFASSIVKACNDLIPSEVTCVS